ncbi:hypothetical protein [Staphylospora marina]|uniref:hypothetical protein n=1 Tax=Staphylospora marina TaxID=2490858 RepID=UPI000F5BEB51|nr:hypothetical protein [Staphylospora marina]
MYYYYDYEDLYASQQQFPPFFNLNQRVAVLEAEVRRLNRTVQQLERRVDRLERGQWRPAPRHTDNESWSD